MPDSTQPDEGHGSSVITRRPKSRRRGSGLAHPNLTVAFALDQGRRGLQPTTISARGRIIWSLEQFMRPQGAEHAKADDVERWLDGCKLAPRSRYTYLSAVTAWFDFLKRRGVVKVDPTECILRPKLSRLVPRPAAPDDIAFAMKVAQPMMRAWLSLAVYQGFRCVEISRLRREDILDKHEPPLLRVAEGKGGHEAVLPLNAHTEWALRTFGLPDRGFVFLTRDGRPYKPGSVSRYSGLYLRSLNIDATMHQLRHLFGTTLWARSKDLRLTQEMMRHADPRSTSAYIAYDHAAALDVMRNLSLD